MLWSILICTMPHRRKLLKRLLDALLPQLKPDMEVLALCNNGEKTLGEFRGKLMHAAQGKYLSFIDDDDLVPKGYVKTIYPLLDGVDYIGFKVRFTDRGRRELPVIHSLRYRDWSQDGNGFYRDISHLNPIKRELATRVDFPSLPGNGEDHWWANQMRPLVKTEHFIDKEMYYYEHTEDSMFSGGKDKIDNSPPLVVKHKQFRYIEE